MNVKLEYEEVIAALVQDLSTRDKALQAVFAAHNTKPKYTLQDCIKHLKLQLDLPSKASGLKSDVRSLYKSQR